MALRQFRDTMAGSDTGKWLATIVLVLIQARAVAVFIRRSWQALRFPYPLDYGEGPLLDQVVRLARCHNIYRLDLTSPPYVITNYPPLYMLLQVPFVPLFGPAYWYGRAISSLSALAAAVFIGLTLHTLTKDWVAATVGGLTLLAIPYIVFWSSLNRIDSLALMLSWAGLYVTVNWSDQRWSLFVTAFLLAAAIYTRQTYGLAAPLAAFVWLWSQHLRRRALALTAVTGSLSLGLFVMLNLLSSGSYYFSTVASNVNVYSVARAFSYLSKLARHMPFLLASSGVYLLLGLRLRLQSWWLVGPYLIGAGLTTSTIGKVGSNVNYLLELSAAFSLAAGALVAWQSRRAWLRGVVLLPLAVQIGVLTQWSLTDFALPQARQRAEMDQLMQMVHRANGPILADEYMGLLPLDGRSLYIEPIGLAHLVRAGKWDQQPFVDAIERQEFELIIIHPLYASERWTSEMLDQINTSYEHANTVAGAFIYQARK